MSVYGNPVILGGAGSGTIIPKTITQNGVYTATDEGADGYSPITVNVGGTSGVNYGFCIDSTVDISQKTPVIYLADALSMTPAKMNYSTGVFDYGSWENAFFMPKPCMLKFDGTVDYYLNPNDYSKKADGTASDVANINYGGNAMMEWGQNGKKIWYKFTPSPLDNTSVNVFVADNQIDPDYKCWSFINSQNQVVDHFYTPIYNGVIDSSNRIRSISGQRYRAGTTKTQEVEYCRNNNPDLPIWDTEVYSDVLLINILLVLISKSINTQQSFGYGICQNGSQSIIESYVTGAQNARGLFYGTNSGTASVSSNTVKVFGMENWWGLVYRRIAGSNGVNGEIKYKLTRGTADGSTCSDYVASGTAEDYSGYLSGGQYPIASSMKFIKKEQFTKWTMFPKELFSGNGTSFSDQYFSDGSTALDTGVFQCIRGGSSYNIAEVGAFQFNFNAQITHSAFNVGCAVSCKPLI